MNKIKLCVDCVHFRPATHKSGPGKDKLCVGRDDAISLLTGESVPLNAGWQRKEHVSSVLESIVGLTNPWGFTAFVKNPEHCGPEGKRWKAKE